MMVGKGLLWTAEDTVKWHVSKTAAFFAISVFVLKENNIKPETDEATAHHIAKLCTEKWFRWNSSVRHQTSDNETLL